MIYHDKRWFVCQFCGKKFQYKTDKLLHLNKCWKFKIQREVEDNFIFDPKEQSFETRRFYSIFKH